MAISQKRNAISLGWTPFNALSGALQNLNTTGTWFAYSFIPPETKTLNVVRMFCSGNGGTLTNIAVSCDLYSSLNGAPNVSLESKSIEAGSWAAGWKEFTGFTTQVTNGVVYWLVFKNISVNPTTNYPQVGYQQNCVNPPYAGNFSLFSWLRKTSTDGGSTWSGTTSGVAGFRLAFSDGTYNGLPISATGNSDTKIYANSEVGVKLNTPAGITMNVIAVAFYVTFGGTPIGDLRFRIYNGTTLLGTTLAVSKANISTAGWVLLYFPVDIVITAGTQIRVVASETTQSDSSSNYYGLFFATFDDTAESKALMPLGMMKTSTVDATATPVVWTDDNTKGYPFALILDTAGEFGVTGGLKINPGLSGGLR
ncbi:MAG: hypothetical protein WC769_01570 [Thermodesulfovibrionales bacterium]|jgi:hypothetical protein